MTRRGKIEFSLHFHGLWERIFSFPPTPDPPFHLETMEPIDVPPGWHWRDDRGPPPEEWDSRWEAPELPLDDGRTLVLDADPLPPDELPVFFAN